MELHEFGVAEAGAGQHGYRAECRTNFPGSQRGVRVVFGPFAATSTSIPSSASSTAARSLDPPAPTIRTDVDSCRSEVIGVFHSEVALARWTMRAGWRRFRCSIRAVRRE